MDKIVIVICFDFGGLLGLYVDLYSCLRFVLNVLIYGIYCSLLCIKSVYIIYLNVRTYAHIKSTS